MKYWLFLVAKRERIMTQCYKAGNFKKYFVENMNELGLNVPSGMFQTAKNAIQTSALIIAAIHHLGKGATMAEIGGATVALEKVVVLGGMLAYLYGGVAIGSIAVATGRSLGCGSRISDMFVYVNQNNLRFRGWHPFYFHHPEIFDKNDHNRRRFGMKINQQRQDILYVVWCF